MESYLISKNIYGKGQKSGNCTNEFWFKMNLRDLKLRLSQTIQ